MKNIMLVLNQVWKGRSRGVFSNENQIYQKIRYITLIILLLFAISCSLDRTNPLDPLVSGKGYPGEVHNVHVTIPANNSVTITWTPVPNVMGYYVYRSQSYDGLYELITPDGINFPVNGYEDSFEFNPEVFFWYKVSAYIMVDGEKLEGFRSEPTTWNL